MNHTLFGYSLSSSYNDAMSDLISLDTRRVRTLNTQPVGSGPVVYWMSRDQRVNDNWALLWAIQQAQEQQTSVAVVFVLTPNFLGATQRHYDFMLHGLNDIQVQLARRHIPFYVLTGQVVSSLVHFVKSHQIGSIVCDFSPVKIGREWRENLAQSVKISVTEVDTHNIVPCWLASDKQEVGARTLRPKIQRLLPEFMTEFPQVTVQTHVWPDKPPAFDPTFYLKHLKYGLQVPPVTWIKPGEIAAQQALQHFIQHRLPHYAAQRNNPTGQAQSDLSPYLHFGHLSAQRVAWAVNQAKTSQANRDAFLEELIIRRELSDNFCFYNPDYASVEGFPAWAQRSLDKHQSDKRQPLYTFHELEQAQTHDELWNAAQLEMVKRGKMHGYLRMYWAKKILEWSPNPATALKWAIELNDRYELDGRDPNGYAGIAWSIGGVHDRPWFERPIFGQIRYMNYNGASRKFSIPAYLAYVATL